MIKDLGFIAAEEQDSIPHWIDNGNSCGPLNRRADPKRPRFFDRCPRALTRRCTYWLTPCIRREERKEESKAQQLPRTKARLIVHCSSPYGAVLETLRADAARCAATSPGRSI